MHTKGKAFSKSDLKLLGWISSNVLVSEFMALIRESLKWGPIPSLKGELYEIHSSEISNSVWFCFLELEDWGAAVRHQTSAAEDFFLLADAIHIELILRAARKFLDDNGYGLRRNYEALQLSRRLELRTLAKKNSKKSDSENNSFELR